MAANWTPEQKKWLKRYLKPQIDRVWAWWEPRQEARAKAKGTRYGMQICCECKGEFLRGDTDVDHVDPTVPVGTEGFEDIGNYIERRFCQVENLRVVCKDCHKKKTQKENAERRKARAATKTSSVAKTKVTKRKRKLRR